MMIAHRQFALSVLVAILAFLTLTSGQGNGTTTTTTTNNTATSTGNTTTGNNTTATGNGTANSSCGTNEVFANSGQDCLTCAQPTASCPLITEARCYCQQGYVRNSSSSCILPADCSPNDGCYANATLAPISSNCFTCDNYRTATCALSIASRCYCLDGYVLDLDNRRCVYPTDCPVYTAGECRSNQTYSDRGYDCDTCANYYTSSSCRLSRQAKCYCNVGYVRDIRTRRCINIADCPGPNNLNEDCTVNQTLATSGYDCASCDNPEATCQITTGSKCYCNNGYIRTASGDCVQHQDCPKAQLPAGTSCRDPWGIGCNPECIPTCRRRMPAKFLFCSPECHLCRCRAGHVRDDSGNCVAQNQCREFPYTFPYFRYTF